MAREVGLVAPDRNPFRSIVVRAVEDGDPELMEVKRGFYHSIRRAVGLEKHFLTALSQRVRATPELIVETIRMSAQCGADGTTIAHYDTAPQHLMRAVREGFEELGIVVRREQVSL